jgi:hypothetical protein
MVASLRHLTANSLLTLLSAARQFYTTSVRQQPSGQHLTQIGLEGVRIGVHGVFGAQIS